jgi:hypothetical protein
MCIHAVQLHGVVVELYAQRVHLEDIGRLLINSDDVMVAKSMVAALNLSTAARCWSVKPQPTWRTEK